MKDQLDDYPVGQLLPGTKYVTVRKLGRGGMGVVYEVVKEPGIRGAAKIMSARLARRNEAVARFYDEAARVAKLRHPNIVQIIDYDRLGDGTPFFVMELLEGKTLGQLLRDLRGRGVRPEHAFAIQTQLLAGLHHAHTVRLDERARDTRDARDSREEARAPIVHRDIKPDNIFLHLPRIDGAEPSVKILDLGISAASGEANEKHFVGSYPWAAPEQFKLEPATPQTDLYAAGLVLYTMLTGANPFEDLETHEQFMMAHVVQPPPPLPDWVPAEVSALVMSALAKAPADRPVSAYEFSSKLWSLQFVRRTGEPGRDMNTTAPTLGTLADWSCGADDSGAEAAVVMAALNEDTLPEPPAEFSPETHARGLAAPMGVCGTMPEKELSEIPTPPSVRRQLDEQAELARAITRTQSPGDRAPSKGGEVASTAGIAQSVALQKPAPPRRRTAKVVAVAMLVAFGGVAACVLARRHAPREPVAVSPAIAVNGAAVPAAAPRNETAITTSAARAAPSMVVASAAAPIDSAPPAVGVAERASVSARHGRAKDVTASPAPSASSAAVDHPLESFDDDTTHAASRSAPAKPASRAKRPAAKPEKGEAPRDWLEPWDGPEKGGAK